MTINHQKVKQGFAVELNFDPETEIAIRSFREKIYTTGVDPVLGKLNDRPHVSLAVFKEVDLPCLKELTNELAKSIPPFSVILSAIGTFPTSDNVLYISPVPTMQLLKVHEQFHNQLKCTHLHSSTYYHPRKWMPHCTIEVDLSWAQFTLAAKAARDNFTPIHGQFTSLGIVSFRPINYLAEYNLTKEE